MKLTVPYYSQFVGVEDSFWMIRACGAACLKMVTEYHGAKTPDIVSLCNEAKVRGGYDMKNGWVHDYLVLKAKELNLNAERREGLMDLSEIIVSLDKGNPVIVSVEKRVLEQSRFHLVVIVGYDDDTITYHESESTDKNLGEYRVCIRSVFMDFWRGKAIFISK